MSQILSGGGTLPVTVPTTFRTSSGDAIPALNIITFTNGSNISMSGAGSAVTVGVVSSPTFTTTYSTTFDTNVAAAGVTLSGTTLSADGTDVDININITAKGAGQVIIDDLQLGTPLTVPYGGMGAATHTIHGVLLGNAAGAINSVVDVTNAGYVLTANVGADPSFQAVPTYTLPADVPETFTTDSGTATPALHSLAVLGGTNLNSSGAAAAVTLNLDDTITLTGVNATTFDTNVLAAGTTLSGTTWAADGTDVNIGMTITPKGTGNLTLTTGDVSLTSGNLLLPTTSSTVGQIQINSVPYFHNGGNQYSVYVGPGAGKTNIPLTPSNVAIGYNALASSSNDAGGGVNTAIGFNALNGVTSGYYNFGLGQSAGYRITTGIANVMIGRTAGQNITNGGYNIVMGDAAGSSQSGGNSSCILISNAGANESNKIRIGTYGTGNGQQDACYIAGIYNTAVGATAGVVLSDSSHQLGGLAGAANTIFVGGTKPSFTATPQCTDLTLTGVLKLPTTTSTVGQIQINSLRFIHSYGDSNGKNTFVGRESGNFTMAGGTTSVENSGFGFNTLKALTDGAYNAALGSNGLQAVTTGTRNASCGHGGLSSLTTGSRNTAVGQGSGYLIVDGSYNTIIGFADGTNRGGENLRSNDSSNIIIGNTGVVGDNNKIRIGTQGSGSGQHNATYIAGIYGVTPGGTKNIALVDSNGQLGSAATISQSYIVNGLTWNNSTSTPVTAAVNNEYTINTASGLTTINLPATFAVNDRIKIVGSGVDGWTLVAASGDYIRLDTSSSSAGGSLSSTNRYNCVEVVCTVANLDWVVCNSMGTLTVA